MIEGEAKKIIEDTKSGVCFASEDYIGMANFLKDVLENKEILSLKNQVNIDKYLNKNFNKEKILKSLERYFIKLQEKFKLINNLSKIPFDKNFSLLDCFAYLI